MTWRDYFTLRKSSDPAPPPSNHDAEVRFYADANGALRSLQPDGTDAAVGGGGGGSQTFQQVTVPITSEQILALNSEPVTLIEAPGAGNVIFPLFAIVHLEFATTLYTAPSGDDSVDVTWNVVWNGPAPYVPGAVEVTNTLANSQDQFGWSINDNNSDDSLQLFENMPIIAWNTTGDYTDGDSPAKITVGYVVIPV